MDIHRCLQNFTGYQVSETNACAVVLVGPLVALRVSALRKGGGSGFGCFIAASYCGSVVISATEHF